MKTVKITPILFFSIISLICLAALVGKGLSNNTIESGLVKTETQPTKNWGILNDTLLIINKIQVNIIVPKEIKCDLLVLPGWNFNRKLWCDSSKLCKVAKQLGYRLIMPEMGKSVYTTKYYSETRKDWLKYPTLTWLTDTLIPYLQKNKGIFCSKNNFIIGNSTGARGALLVVIKTNNLFVCGAALSGDYNQVKMPNDNLMKGVYGSYYNNKARWKNTDNPSSQIQKLNTSFYFAHGTKDKIVPYEQTKLFYDSAIIAKPNLKFKLHSPMMGHNFKFWNSELDSIFLFFESFVKK